MCNARSFLRATTARKGFALRIHQGCRGDGISIPYPSHTHRNPHWNPHGNPHTHGTRSKYTLLHVGLPTQRVPAAVPASWLSGVAAHWGAKTLVHHSVYKSGTKTVPKNYPCLLFSLLPLYNTELELLHACYLFSQARTQMSYRPITTYSVDSDFFTSGRGRHFDLSPLAV